ncbi:type 1 fimbrial protein [Enterobacter cloacae complex sp. P6RS]|uniref:fimbrial protein n=1 Tax=unclassified Enterobacter cloacae complex TaxID=2757714 RepID=UPI0018735743|nr:MULTISPECIES: fimbrial protein [unclassified Enterobacter cloacae complex]MBE4913768.1 type 1 fimbrial protein [Enterobacter cloacae complex sp. P4RS]MBE4990683.1 type 1 fimbrial protein [Enterobacter cloacae complex sp. P6RS]
MKLNKIVMAIVLAGSVVSFAQAKDQGHGTVTFVGSIIDAPCSISPDSIDQTVKLGEISNVALNANGNTGSSIPRPFEIKLENCDTTTQKTVTATFTGAEDSAVANHLGITGTASGAGIVLTDGSGKPIELGKPTDAHMLQDGNNTLMFSAYLQGDGASAVVPGDFSAIADFTLAYQ